MRRGRGRIQYEDLVAGTGPAANRGTQVEIRYTLALNNGDVVQHNENAIFCVGHRRVFAGLDYGVKGMRVGGTRHLRVGPHLGYGSGGVFGRLPLVAADLTAELGHR